MGNPFIASPRWQLGVHAAGVVAVLSALAWALWPTSERSTAVTMPAAESAATTMAESASPARLDLSGFAKRLSAERGPVTPVAEPVVVSERLPPFDFVVIGIRPQSADVTHRRALFYDHANRQVIEVAAGDTIGAYTLAAIDQGGLELRWRDLAKRIKLDSSLRMERDGGK